MSAVSKPKKLNPLEKKIPENPRYKDVKHTIDTGASVSNYMRKIEQINKYYKKTPNEIFKRMKVSTFAQLVVQVFEFNEVEGLETLSEAFPGGDTPYTDRPDTTDREIGQIQNNGQCGSPVPSIALTDGDFGITKSDLDTSRSTLQSVIGGIGEVDLQSPPAAPQNRFVHDDCPYLLLDCRDADAYNQCHIISAINYPKAMISRATNYFIKEIYVYQNKPGKVIIVYDEDEKVAPTVVSTMVDRGIENVFLLSGGLKKSAHLFKEGFITGTVPENVSGVKVKNPVQGSQKLFTKEDIENLKEELDVVLSDRSCGSRLSKASTSASRAGSISQMSTKSARSTASTITSRPAFR